MRSLLGAALVFSLAWQAEAGARHCTFRVHLTANANDGDVFAQPIRSLTGHDVYIDKTPWISERDVVAFCPYRAADGGSYAALLVLDNHGRTVLDTLSIEHRGSQMFIFINDRPLTELQVDRRVSDGKIYLPGGLTEKDIKLMNRDWKLLGLKKRK
jgi:hypothetical protein